MDHQEAVSRAHALAPAIRERAVEIDAARRIPRDIIDTFVGQGLGRLLQPKRWGGYEISHAAAFEVAVEIGRASGSAGWCCSFLNIHDWQLCAFPDEAQHDVWRDGPDVNLAGVVAATGKAVPADGGYRLSGRWQWASGVAHCEWAILGGVAMPAGPGQHPTPMLFLVPKADYRVDDIWYCAGMKGSGSNDIVIDDVFIPAHHTCDMAAFREGTGPGTEKNTGPIYTVPLLSAFAEAMTGPILGIGLGAYDDFRALIPRRVSSMTGEKIVDTEVLQIKLGTALSELDAAELMLRRNLAVIRDGGPIETPVRLRSAFYWSQATKRIIAAVDTLMYAAGSSAFMETSPLQRAWRDLHVLGSHVGLDAERVAINIARAELGQERDPRLRIW